MLVLLPKSSKSISATSTDSNPKNKKKNPQSQQKSDVFFPIQLLTHGALKLQDLHFDRWLGDFGVGFHNYSWSLETSPGQ